MVFKWYSMIIFYPTLPVYVTSYDKAVLNTKMGREKSDIFVLCYLLYYTAYVFRIY